MSDFFDQLERQLRQVATQPPPVGAPARGAAFGGVRRRRARRLAPRRRRALAGLGAALVAAAGAAAATDIWRPLLGPANAPVHPTISALAPPAAQLRLLAVLRRRQTPVDRSAATRAQLLFVGSGDAGVRTAYIRRLGVVDGAAIVLVPVARVRLLGPGVTAPAPVHATIADALCLVYGVGGARRSGKACFDSTQLRDGRALIAIGSHMAGLVPDGVTGVEIRFRGGASVTTSAASNLFVARLPAGAGQPSAIVWTLRDGRRETFAAPAAVGV